MSPHRRSNRRWQNRPLVRERDAARARWMWAMLALLIAALAPTGVYLYEQNSCLQLSYEIEEIESQRETLAEAQRRLEVDYAGIASMNRIERWAARQRLTRPAAEEIVVVPPDLVVSDPILARTSLNVADPAAERQRRGE